MIILKNNAQSVLAVPVSEEQTLLNLSLGDGAIFPDLSLGDHFRCALKDSAGNLEFVKVTQRSGDMLTVERGQEGTVARSWQAGTRIQLRMTAKTWEEMASYHMQRVSDADGTPLLPTRTSDTTFTLPGDLTALFEQSRAITIHGSDGEKVSGYVASAGFDSEFTTVTIEGMTLPSSILLLELGLPLGVHPKASNAAPAAHLNDPNAHAELFTELEAQASDAQHKADAAKSAADEVLTIANDAQKTANTAQSTANTAKATADSALTLASTANSKETARFLGKGGDVSQPMKFFWSAQSVQPTYVWGGSDGTNMYVYNPSNFSVNAARSATSAATTPNVAPLEKKTDGYYAPSGGTWRCLGSYQSASFSSGDGGTSYNWYGIDKTVAGGSRVIKTDYSYVVSLNGVICFRIA